MKRLIFQHLRLLLVALGFKVRPKDILLLENWRDESSKNRNFNSGIRSSRGNEVPVRKPTPIKRMREVSERSGIKIADEV